MAHPNVPFASSGPGDLRTWSNEQLSHASTFFKTGGPARAIKLEISKRRGPMMMPTITRAAPPTVPGRAARTGIPRARGAIPGSQDLMDDFGSDIFDSASNRGRQLTEVGFIHKRLIGAATGLLTGGPGGALLGFAGGGGSSVPVNVTGPPGGFPALAGPTPCKWPAQWDPRTGTCKAFLGRESGFDRPPLSDRGGRSVGGMGGWEPNLLPASRSECGRGAVLGRDSLCYDKRSIRNSDRMWPKARRPLLTGGDLSCIAKASRAANRMKTQTKRLQKLGMLPKARRGR